MRIATSMSPGDEKKQDEIQASCFSFLDELRKEVGPEHLSWDATLATMRQHFPMFDDSFLRRTVLTWFETYYSRHPEESSEFF